jgi:hypothetical protein
MRSPLMMCSAIATAYLADIKADERLATSTRRQNVKFLVSYLAPVSAMPLKRVDIDRA